MRRPNKRIFMRTPEVELLHQVARRDQEALMALYERYSNLVFSLCLRVLRQPVLAEEVTQDVFLKIWNHPDRWDPALGQFSSWLLAITRNAAIDRLRREGRQATVDWDPADNPDAGISEFVGDQPGWYDGQLLRKLLLRLPGEQRQLIELAFYDGYTHSELAALLHLPLGTVKTRLRMGMQKLRVLWEETAGKPQPN
jgi:RNA polymerase sigma-70 factor (ECF subfamily)